MRSSFVSNVIIVKKTNSMVMVLAKVHLSLWPVPGVHYSRQLDEILSAMCKSLYVTPFCTRIYC